MSPKELANQLRESITFEYQLSDLDVIKLFSKGIKGIPLEESIDRSSNRNSFLNIIDGLSEEQ